MLQSNDFLFLGKGHGWTLDRRAFDRLLHDRACACADLAIEGRVSRLQQRGNQWAAAVNGEDILARCVVDATGRAAAGARLAGGRPVLSDRLVAVVREGACAARGSRGITVAAAPDGWWYSAPTGENRRMWAWLTDSDLLRDQPISDDVRWVEALAAVPEMACFADGAVFGPRQVVPAMTQHMPAPPGADMLLSVGDAASSFDPASSQGIAKALRSGIFAGYALHDCLVKGDQTALAKHRTLTTQEFGAYRAQHEMHYRAETRWPANPFWSRRQRATVA